MRDAAMTGSTAQGFTTSRLPGHDRLSEDEIVIAQNPPGGKPGATALELDRRTIYGRTLLPPHDREPCFGSQS